MYKILHWLFGWDYIAWENSWDEGIAKVHVSANGRVWYWRYRNIAVWDEIKASDQVLWLTCHPDKYLNKAAK